MVYLSARSDRSSSVVKRQIELLMRERRRLDPEDTADFSIRDMQEIIAAVSSATGTMTALLGGIAAVSLLVGGIGIMNIMLVSVSERTREIGIRLAIGARSSDVLLQFLVEAVVLSMLGGLFGVLFGVALGYAGARLLGLPVLLSPSVVGLSFAFSADGRHYSGRYFEVIEFVDADVYAPAWEGWRPYWPEWLPHWYVGSVDRITWPAFVEIYTGRVIANLSSNDKTTRLRCRFQINDPRAGLSGGGNGDCQLSTGETIEHVVVSSS